MGFFDDVSDAVDDAVDEAEDVADDAGDAIDDAVDEAQDVASDVGDAVGEAAGDVTEGAGDVADEVSEGDVGGAVDEATDTVEDVASGSADTGSSDDDGGISIGGGGDDDGGSSSGGSSGGGSSGGSDDDDDSGGSSPTQTVKDKGAAGIGAAKETVDKGKKAVGKAKDVGSSAREKAGEASDEISITEEREKARKGLDNAREAAQEISQRQEKLEETRARRFQLDASQLSRKEKKRIGVSTDASGRVEVDKQQYDALLEKREEEARDQAERFQNFLAEADRNREIQNLQATLNDPDASPTEKARAAEELADKVGGRQAQELDQFAEDVRERQQFKQTDEFKEQRLRELVEENPELLATGGEFNDPNDKPVESLKQGDFNEFVEDVTTTDTAPEPVREEFKNLRDDLDLTKGEIDTIQGEEASERTTENLEKPFGSENPVVEFGAQGVAGLASLADEARDALPDVETSREFDSPTERQLFDTRTGRTATTDELMDGETIEIGGQEITVEERDRSPELDINVEEGDPFKLQDARTVERERVDELADSFGRGVGGVASLPSEVQRRGGQAQQLASGEMTAGEAAERTQEAISGAASAIAEDPLKASVTAVPGIVTGTAASRAANLGKLRARAIRGARTRLPDRVPGSINRGSSGSSTIVLGQASDSASDIRRGVDSDNFPDTDDLPYNIRAAPDPDSFDVEDVAPSRQDLLRADADTLSKTRSELTEVPQDVLRGSRRTDIDTRSPGRDIDSRQRNQRIRDVADEADEGSDDLMSLNEEARRRTDLDTADDLGTDRTSGGDADDAASSVRRIEPEEGFRPEAREVLSRRRPGRGVDVEDVTETGGLALRVIDESDVGRPTVSLGDAADAFVDSNRISFAGTGAVVDVIEEQRRVEADFSDAVEGTQGLAGSGDTIDDLALRQGDTGQTDPAIFRNSPGRPRVGNDAPADTSGQVIGLSSVGGGAVVGGSQVSDEVISINEGRERRAPSEFESPVVGLGATEGQLPPQAEGNAPVNPIVQPPEPRERRPEDRGRGTTGKDVRSEEPVEPEVPDIGTPIFDRGQTPADRQGEVVDQRPGVDQRDDATVFPQGIAANIVGTQESQGFDEGFAQTPATGQQQAQDLRVDEAVTPANAFGNPAPPAGGGRPRDAGRPDDGGGFLGSFAGETEIFRRNITPEPPSGGDDEERARRTEPREDDIFPGERIWPFQEGTDLLFGDRGGGRR